MGRKGDDSVNRQLFDAMVTQYKKQTVTGTDSVVWSGGAHCYLPSLKFYGASKLSKTPSPNAPVDIYDHIGIYSVNSESEYIGIPTLRSVGDKSSSAGIIRDEWDYVTGKGIRRIKELVLDGETHKVTSATAKSGRIELSEPCLTQGNSGVTSTHFAARWDTNHGSIYALDSNLIIMSMDGSMNVEEWNVWLKEQYDSGTPVKIYYALKEPTEFFEQLQGYYNKPIANDGGRITFVDGNISGVPFEATYITHS